MMVDSPRFRVGGDRRTGMWPACLLRSWPRTAVRSRAGRAARHAGSTRGTRLHCHRERIRASLAKPRGRPAHGLPAGLLTDLVNGSSRLWSLLWRLSALRYLQRRGWPERVNRNETPALAERIRRYPGVALGAHQDHDWYYVRAQWYHARQAGRSQGSRLLRATLSDCGSSTGINQWLLNDPKKAAAARVSKLTYQRARVARD